MKPTKRIVPKTLIFLFLGVFIIKAIQSFFMKGTFLYSDEACVIQKAIYLAEHFSLATCQSIVGAPAGEPQHFESILIAPIYYFLKGMNAYYAVLILHSLLVSTIIFPLYKIFKKFIKSDLKVYFITFVIVFLPFITVYEKMLATEAIFVVLNIWMIYFYWESFLQKKKNQRVKYKILAIIFALVAAFARPFGFITILALTINEIIQQKKRKIALLILAPITILLIAFALYTVQGMFGMLVNRTTDLLKPDMILVGLIAIKNQINTLTLTTAIVPLIIFVSCIFAKNPKELKKIRWFLIVLIAINFLISANHIYGYLKKGEELHLLERYINLSIILIIVFFYIFIEKYKKFQFNIKNLSIIGICLVSLALLEYQLTKHALNLGLSIFYNTDSFMEKNRAPSTPFLAYYYIPVIFALFMMLVLNKKKLLTYSISIVFLAYSSLLYLWVVDFSAAQQDSNIFNYFKNGEVRILYLVGYKKKKVPYNFWRIQALTGNKEVNKYVNDVSDKFEMPDFTTTEAQEYLENYDYIISVFIIPSLSDKQLKLPSAGEFVYKLHD